MCVRNSFNTILTSVRIVSYTAYITFLESQHRSNYQDKKSNHIYFTGTLDASKLAAELAVSGSRGRIYIVEPTDDFENVPNVTDKRFPDNPTGSYRSKSPMKIIEELGKWERHSDDENSRMLTALQTLR